MNLVGGAVVITGRDILHAAAAASLTSTRSARETVMAAQLIRAEFDLLRLPTVAAAYRRVGRDAWRQYREMGEQAKACRLRSVLADLTPLSTMH